eukprot:CAMPEP_0182576506 /NCGR_PEP_ID=MMETSP1324-20130603/34141_1 /TAXON_ID=236786 /ORGANISM="Florenciella sp., Strain RCC1587" /LENGTH=142 /DNA_ID=CAMNT_0024792221 /DNA_START=771 /DNA_END=1199 /DNA_ORIENTATION=+
MNGLVMSSSLSAKSVGSTFFLLFFAHTVMHRRPSYCEFEVLISLAKWGRCESGWKGRPQLGEPTLGRRPLLSRHVPAPKALLWLHRASGVVGSNPGDAVRDCDAGGGLIVLGNASGVGDDGLLIVDGVGLCAPEEVVVAART